MPSRAVGVADLRLCSGLRQRETGAQAIATARMWLAGTATEKQCRQAASRVPRDYPQDSAAIDAAESVEDERSALQSASGAARIAVVCRQTRRIVDGYQIVWEGADEANKIVRHRALEILEVVSRPESLRLLEQAASGVDARAAWWNWLLQNGYVPSEPEPLPTPDELEPKVRNWFSRKNKSQLKLKPIREKLKDRGLEHVAKQLLKKIRPCVQIKTERVEDSELPVGGSKFGGCPDLPKGVRWPKSNDAPQYFLAQINLAELDKYQIGLPKQGLLSFFYDSTGDMIGTEQGAGTVLFFESPPSQRCGLPAALEEEHCEPCRLEFHFCPSLPGYYPSSTV